MAVKSQRPSSRRNVGVDVVRGHPHAFLALGQGRRGAGGGWWGPARKLINANRVIASARCGAEHQAQ